MRTLYRVVTASVPSVVFSLLLVGCSRTDGWRPSDFYTDPNVIALLKAVERSDLDEIDRLVAEGVDSNSEGKDGMTPLLWARWAKSKESFLRLLERGADPNRQIFNGDSIMSIAAEDFNESYWLETVLKHGGNPNLVNPKGYVWTHQTPIFQAIESGKVHHLNLLIEAGASINYQDSSGNTPLIHAVHWNAFECMYRLLDAGADYRIKNQNGKKVACMILDEPPGLIHEERPWRKKVLEFLEKKGIDLQAVKKAEEAARRKPQGEVRVEPKAPLDDQQRIQGHWIALTLHSDGKTSNPKGQHHNVFTDKEVKISGPDSGISFKYTLDPAKTPKQIDLVLPVDPSFVLLGIYRFEGERFVVCTAMRVGEPRPERFVAEDGDGHEMGVLERCDKSPPPAKPGFHPASNELAQAIQKRLEQAAALLEEKQCEKFVKEFLGPNHGVDRKGNPEAGPSSFPEQMARPLAGLLRALNNKTCLVNPDETEAIFDVRDIHVNGAAPKPEIKFAKINGRWYFAAGQ